MKWLYLYLSPLSLLVLLLSYYSILLWLWLRVWFSLWKTTVSLQVSVKNRKDHWSPELVMNSLTNLDTCLIFPSSSLLKKRCRCANVYNRSKQVGIIRIWSVRFEPNRSLPVNMQWTVAKNTIGQQVLIVQFGSIL